MAPTEWEAIQACRQVAGGTKWTEWKGLPGSAKLYEYLRHEADWTTAPVAKSDATNGDVGPALASAHKKLFRHISILVHEARTDRPNDGRCRRQARRRSAHLYSQPESAGASRGDSHDVGHHARSCGRAFVSRRGRSGRSNGGNAGAEDEAVVFSTGGSGKPVRVQWMRAEDYAMVTQSAAAFSDVQLALDEKGKLVGYQIDHYMPAMQDDRPIGAVIAGLPTMPAPEVMIRSATSTVNRIADPWIYGHIPNVIERGHGTFQVGKKLRRSLSASGTTACVSISSSKISHANWL